MNNAEHEVNRRLQSNRHINERNENSRLEQQSNTALKARHKLETEQSRFGVGTLETAMELRRRQAHEFDVLRYRQGQTRIALDKQHTQEVAAFDRPLS